MTDTQPVETILVVEDEPPIRPLIRRSLKGQGYQVLQACNGEEALSLAANYRGPINLLVTDVVMPHMDGFTLGEQLVKSHPETRVLFVAGYTNQSAANCLREAGHAFLLKPFTHQCLLRTIREQLDTEPN